MVNYGLIRTICSNFDGFRVKYDYDFDRNFSTVGYDELQLA